MDDTTAGHIAAKLADLVRDPDNELYAETSHVLEGGRDGRFTLRLPNGQVFTVQITEAYDL